jgi:hypothetical protein
MASGSEKKGAAKENARLAQAKQFTAKFAAVPADKLTARKCRLLSLVSGRGARARRCAYTKVPDGMLRQYKGYSDIALLVCNYTKGHAAGVKPYGRASVGELARVMNIHGFWLNKCGYKRGTTLRRERNS